MQPLTHFFRVLLAVFFIFNHEANAQDIDSDYGFQRYQALVIATSERGWNPQVYLTASNYNQLKNTYQNPNEFQALLGQYTLKVASDLHRGRVTPLDIQTRTRIPEKRIQFQNLISAYLSGRTELTTLLAQIEPQHIIYQQQVHLLKYVLQTQNLPEAKVPTGIIFSKLKLGDSHETLIPYLQLRLNLLGYQSDSNSTVYDSETETLVRQYQADHKLVPDGTVGPNTWSYLNRDFKHIAQSVRANLDRSRWLPNRLEAERVMVNIADQRLSYIESNLETMSFKAIVGRLDRQTPLMVDAIRHVVLNPTWTVPYSIFINDKLPLLKKDPSFVARNQYKLINDKTGLEVDAKTINWKLINASNAHYTLIQKPGKQNALGFIKFPLQNPHAIYLHDTNDRALFSGQRRLFSSGCVRLEKPFEFAERLLANPQWTPQSLQEFTELNPVKVEDQTWVKTKKNIPVYLMYWTTFQHDDGRIVVLPDSYGIDQEMITRALTSAE